MGGGGGVPTPDKDTQKTRLEETKRKGRNRFGVMRQND